MYRTINHRGRKIRRAVGMLVAWTIFVLLGGVGCLSNGKTVRPTTETQRSLIGSLAPNQTEPACGWTRFSQALVQAGVCNQRCWLLGTIASPNTPIGPLGWVVRGASSRTLWYKQSLPCQAPQHGLPWQVTSSQSKRLYDASFQRILQGVQNSSRLPSRLSMRLHFATIYGLSLSQRNRLLTVSFLRRNFVQLGRQSVSSDTTPQTSVRVQVSPGDWVVERWNGYHVQSAFVFLSGESAYRLEERGSVVQRSIIHPLQASQRRAYVFRVFAALGTPPAVIPHQKVKSLVRSLCAPVSRTIRCSKQGR